jgi:NMD protein affecting ribosome stability and mRNA decay
MDRKSRRKMMETFYNDIEEHQELLPEIKEINVHYCEESQTFKLKNKWKPFETVEEVYKTTILSTLDKKVDPTAKIEIQLVRRGEKIKFAKVLADKGKTHDEKTYKIHTDRTMNPEMSKKYSKYLEGTLQVRNLREDMFPFLQEQIQLSEQKFCHVIDLREKKTSIDADMTNQKEIARIARAMQRKFGGELKLDYKLQTRDKQTQKDLFRLSATIILPTVKKGEYIKHDSKVFMITSLDKDIAAKNLKTGTLEHIGFHDKFEILEPQQTTIAQVQPSIKALDPVTFQAEQLLLPKALEKKMKIGKKITVVKFGKQLFLQ